MLHPELEEIQHSLKNTLGKTFDSESAILVPGGDINRCYRIVISTQKFFLKVNIASLYKAFKAEQLALQMISRSKTPSCPQVITYGKTKHYAYLLLQHLELQQNQKKEYLLGKQLAHMHRNAGEFYGWQENNYIGRTTQDNKQQTQWHMFWIHSRLQPQRKLAKKNHCSSSTLHLLHQAEKLCEITLKDHQPTPSLLHGDLWSGNAAFTKDGTPVVYDPASYYGDRETDIAMTELFGGFGDRFYEGYQQAWPMEKGYLRRRGIYQLYHVVNHFNLFGPPYDEQAAKLCKNILEGSFSDR